MINYKLTKNVLTIYDGFKTRKWNMRKELRDVKKTADGQQSDVFKRSTLSLKMEWIFHNFLYMVGYQRKRTKDVDLDNPSDHPEWMYILFGILTWIFVW